MTQPMSRDDLARDQWIGMPLGPEAVNARAIEWDEKLVTDDDVADCYRRADEILSGRVAS